jgi:hypothetical protein
MPLTLTEASGLLKEFYAVDGGPADQLHQASPFLAALERSADNIDAESDKAKWGIHTGRNWGVGSIADGDAIPAAGSQTDVKAEQSLKTHVIHCRWTKQVMRAARSSRGALRKAVDGEMRYSVKDLRRQIGRQVLGTADGVIATCTTTSASTTLNLATTTTAVQMRQFEVGMFVDIGTLASPTSQSSANKITAVDASAKTLTLTSAVTTTGSHFVFLRGSGGGPGTGQKELTGLQHAVSDTTTAYGLAPASYPVHKAVVDTNGGVARPATIQAFEAALGNVYLTSGYMGKRMGLTTVGIMNALSAQMQTQRRYGGDRTALAGGYTGLSVYTPQGDVVFAADKDVPTGNAFLLALDEWIINEWQPAGWEDEDGNVLKYVSGYLEYEAIYSWMMDIATTQRNANWRGTNFTE